MILPNAVPLITCSITVKTLLFDILLLSRSHGPNLEPVVEHFFFFLCFCSTFSSARIDFGLRGRTFFLFSLFLFYFQLRAPQFLNQPVDKNHTFPPVFIYWPQRFKGDYGQNGDFWKMPVNVSPRSRAKGCFFKSARNPAQNAAAFTAFVK